MSLSRPALSGQPAMWGPAGSTRTPSPRVIRDSGQEPRNLLSPPPLSLRRSPRTPSPPAAITRWSRPGPMQAQRTPSPQKSRIQSSPPHRVNAPPTGLSTPSPKIVVSSPSPWIHLEVPGRAQNCGVGVQLVKCPDGDIEVLAVREGSDARAAGICQGDRIVSVNGRRVAGLDCRQVGMKLSHSRTLSESRVALSVMACTADLIAGPEGSRVFFSILSWQGQHFDTYVTRRPCAALSPVSFADLS